LWTSCANSGRELAVLRGPPTNYVGISASPRWVKNDLQEAANVIRCMGALKLPREGLVAVVASFQVSVSLVWTNQDQSLSGSQPDKIAGTTAHPEGGQVLLVQKTVPKRQMSGREGRLCRQSRLPQQVSGQYAA
jgi:hypothetical protein